MKKQPIPNRPLTDSEKMGVKTMIQSLRNSIDFMNIHINDMEDFLKSFEKEEDNEDTETAPRHGQDA